MKKRSGIHVGVSSLLLIFLVLCLVSFAVLSLASATADLKLSRRYAARTLGYYEACCDAQDFIAEAAESATEGAQLSKDFPISETQYLHVELSADNTGDGSAVSGFIDTENRSSVLSVTAWQVITDESALQLDESLPVLP